jgi:hypothetical protein
MKKVTYTTGAKVKNTDKQLLRKGILAFQMVYFTINFFGKIITTEHDTKIMKDGSQLVIGGCGYIKEGYQII